jgi:hypothetical protein
VRSQLLLLLSAECQTYRTTLLQWTSSLGLKLEAIGATAMTLEAARDVALDALTW